MLSSSSSPFLLLSFSWLLLVFLPCSSMDGYGDCSNMFNCGNITDVGYPFWGDGRPSDCGHPDLKLSCQPGNLTKIKIKQVTYNVLHINEKIQILKISRDDLFDGFCFPKFPNTTFDPDDDLFEYAPDSQQVSILYDCPTTPFIPPGLPPAPARLDCPSGSAYKSAFVIAEHQAASQCNLTLTVGIIQSYVNGDMGKLSKMEEAIIRGFNVKYKVDTDACSGCTESGGSCGNDWMTNLLICYCPNQNLSSSENKCLPPPPTTGQTANTGPSFKRNLAIAVVVGIIILSIGFIFIWCKRGCILAAIFQNKDGREDVNILLKDESFAVKKYSFSDIKRMTNSLSEKIGKGGFGTVYKGKLPNGRLVAVKILNKSNDRGQGFVNEVRIGKTNHVNIISLLGFCYERTKRVLVYEYMPNGSLDNFIPKKLESSITICQLEWKKIYEIALGIARGLEYLHKYCGTTILHFDIKPQNILLDEDFCPKISDFGLSKLSEKKETSVPVKNPGGTPGFIAPEAIFSRLGEVSHKYDVYSYGMMMLDMVGGRNNAGPKVSDISSEMYFPDSIYQDLELDKDLRILETKTEEESQIARKMVIISFWCIQRSPTDRPAMSNVIEMLEGDLHSLQIPPKPDWSSPAWSPQLSTNLYTAEGSWCSGRTGTWRQIPMHLQEGSWQATKAQGTSITRSILGPGEAQRPTP